MHTIIGRIAIGFLCLLAGVALSAGWIVSNPYEKQDRERLNEAPSRALPLGTDELGRDRLARVVYGTRVSLVLAPAAALLSTLLAAMIGGVAGLAGGRIDRIVLASIDVVLSMPWFFLLLMARAALPLNAPPVVSAILTFLLLGLMGWAHSARLVRSAATGIRDSAYVLQARTLGIPEWGILWNHFLPNVRPVLLAQFWISIPLFILAEANLGLLGLGVSEPLPSWGGLLREMESLHKVTATPWVIAPALLLVATVACSLAAFGPGVSR